MANQNINVNVTANTASATNKIPVQGQTHTAYYPIADGDFDSMKYYESNGYAIRHIMVRGKKHWFVLLPVSSQEDADCLNTAFDTLRKQEEREYARRYGKEISYEGLINEGYDPALDDNDLVEIVTNTIRFKIIWDNYNSFSDEEKRIITAIMNGESEYKISAELQLARTTYRDHVAKLLKKLRGMLKNI